MWRVASLVALPTLLSFALGCIAHRQYAAPAARDQAHLSLQENPRDCAQPEPHAERSKVDCRLVIVEFDDQGSFWNPTQLTNAKAEIVSRSRRDPNEPEKQAIVIVFIHGWNHDARPTDKNLQSFERVLADVAWVESVSAGRPSPRSVVGVFLSWRGQSLAKPLHVPWSIQNRKAAAERVARVSAGHTIHRLVAWTKGTREGTGLQPFEKEAPLAPEPDFDGNPRSVFVVVGHSLGGLILENTLLRSLTHETDDFSVAFPADLAVLVNPANEAILAQQFVQALEKAPPAIIHREGEGETERWSGPGVVSVTSKGDRTTRLWFRLFQSLKGSLLRLRDGDRQRFYYTRTPGHTTIDDGLISHEIRCMNGGEDCEGVPQTASAWRQRNEQRMTDLTQEAGTDDRPLLRPRVVPGACERAAEQARKLRCIETIEFEGVPREDGRPQRYWIERVRYADGVPPEERNRTIYWTFQVPRQIIPNHGEIFDSEFRSLLEALILLKQGSFEVPLVSPREERAGEDEESGG